jgi:hypothetical protein
MSEETLLSGQATTDTGAQQTAEADVSQQQPAAEQGQQAQQGADQQGQQEQKAEGAPEAYADFQVPEGFSLNEAVAPKFSEWAKTHNLTQEAAQAAVTLGAELVQQSQQAQAEAFTSMVADWRKQTEIDKEIGGPQLQENLSYAARLIDTFAPELRQVFDETGMGNHPVMVKALIRIGKAMSEDRLVGGQQQDQGGALSLEQRLYPSMN